MVQRKVPNKLAIQDDLVKSEKGVVHLKPSSSQHQDGKNRGGADLKKKMKKSRSIKRSDFESLRSSPPLRQPEKPPPPDHVPATPQKQSPAKAPEASPNYMKSTSSFDARRERSPVSYRSSQTSVATKSPRPSLKNSNNLKQSSGSGHKASRTLTRTSSLKRVRTLTKSPSFKPARASSKKCSPVALCESFDVQRATCSSTLKDSKFPAYLTLSRGATESEGTSVMKVCSYTYCSLNGHHHAPVPPLKCFLSARRRMLKTQKSIKLGCLSPRRAKPSGEGMKQIDGEIIIAEKPEITPLMQEVHTDFFIEIYTQDGENTADTIGTSKDEVNDKNTADFSLSDIMPSFEGSDEVVAENAGQIAESLSGESPCSEIYFEDNFKRPRDAIATKMEITEFFPEDQNTEAAEETTPECWSNKYDSDIESLPSNQLNESDSEASDMEWEAGQFSAPFLDDVPIFKSPEIENYRIHDEPTLKSDGFDSSSFKEILTEKLQRGLYDEESVSSEAWFEDGGSDMDGSYHSMEREKSIVVSKDQSHSTTYDAFEELTTTEGNNKLDEALGTESIWDPIEELIEESKATTEDRQAVPDTNYEIPRMDLRFSDDETKGTSDREDEALIDLQDNEYPQDGYPCVLLENQESDSSHDTTEQDQDQIYKDYTAINNSIEVNQSDIVAESVLGDISLLPKTDDSETDQNCLMQELQDANSTDGMKEKEPLDAAASSIGIQTFDLLLGIGQDTTAGGNDESIFGAIAEDGELNQNFADEGLSAETQDDSSVEQSQSNAVEDQDHSEKDRGELSSMNTEDQTDSGMMELGLAENSEQVADQMEMEYASNSDAEETCSKTKNASSKESKNLLIHVQSNSNQELPMTCKNLRGTTRCTRPAEESEESREFNPREPNYLPLEPDTEAERVDLKHQMMDERKDAEEWMIDYALQQAVTKLAPARKRKVALLVEAFEKVLPVPKYETHLRHTSAAPSHAMPIQACR